MQEHPILCILVQEDLVKRYIFKQGTILVASFFYISFILVVLENLVSRLLQDIKDES